MRVLWPIRGEVPREPPDSGTGINNVSVVLLGVDRGPPVPAGRRRRGGDRPVAAGRRAAAASTCSRWRITAAGPRRRTRSWPRSGHGSRSPRPGPATRTATRPGRTLERLAESGARVLRTDRDGTVTVTFEAAGLTGPDRAAPGAATARRRRDGGHRAAATRAASTGPLRRLRLRDTGPWPPVTRPIRRATRPARNRRAHDPAEGAARLGYHRVDDGPRARGSRCPALLPRSPALVRRARAGRGRGRRLSSRHASRPTGSPVDRAAVEAAALLHDVDKVLPADDPARTPAARAGLGRVADATGPPGTGATGRGPPGDPPGRRRGVPTLGGLREPRGADRGLRRQAGRAAAGVDGRAVRLVAPPLSRGSWDDSTWRPVRGRADTARGGGLPGSGHRARGRPATGLDGRALRAAPASARQPPDDPAAALRLGRRRARRRATREPVRHGPGRRARLAARALGPPRRPRDGNDRSRPAPRAPRDPSDVRRRDAGGRHEPGCARPRNDTRDRVARGDRACSAAGNAVAFIEAAKSGAKGPSSKQLVDADQGRRRRGSRGNGARDRPRSVPGSRARPATAACAWHPERRAPSPIGWEAG